MRLSPFREADSTPAAGFGHKAIPHFAEQVFPMGDEPIVRRLIQPRRRTARRPFPNRTDSAPVPALL